MLVIFYTYYLQSYDSLKVLLQILHFQEIDDGDEKEIVPFFYVSIIDDDIAQSSGNASRVYHSFPLSKSSEVV